MLMLNCSCLYVFIIINIYYYNIFVYDVFTASTPCALNDRTIDDLSNIKATWCVRYIMFVCVLYIGAQRRPPTKYSTNNRLPRTKSSSANGKTRHRRENRASFTFVHVQPQCSKRRTKQIGKLYHKILRFKIIKIFGWKQQCCLKLMMIAPNDRVQ